MPSKSPVVPPIFSCPFRLPLLTPPPSSPPPLYFFPFFNRIGPLGIASLSFFVGALSQIPFSWPPGRSRITRATLSLAEPFFVLVASFLDVAFPILPATLANASVGMSSSLSDDDLPLAASNGHGMSWSLSFFFFCCSFSFLSRAPHLANVARVAEDLRFRQPLSHVVTLLLRYPN